MKAVRGRSVRRCTRERSLTSSSECGANAAFLTPFGVDLAGRCAAAPAFFKPASPAWRITEHVAIAAGTADYETSGRVR